jgi:zinc transport system ATP-binding protein
MGIDSLASRSYRDLSGGQQQRVLLARALCAAQSILLLDEPVTGLDPKAAAEMYELIEQLNRDGMTVIMITHDTKGAVRYATHVLHIGSTVFYGTRDAYLGGGAGSAYLQENEGGKG